jgi:hypothetical protein
VRLCTISFIIRNLGAFAAPGGRKPGFPLQSFCRRAAKRISAAIPCAPRAQGIAPQSPSSNFAKQNCDQPLAPHGLSLSLNLLTVESLPPLQSENGKTPRNERGAKGIPCCHCEGPYRLFLLLHAPARNNPGWCRRRLNNYRNLIDLCKNPPVLSQVSRNLPQTAANSGIFRGKLCRNPGFLHNCNESWSNAAYA